MKYNKPISTAGVVKYTFSVLLRLSVLFKANTTFFFSEEGENAVHTTEELHTYIK